MNYQQNKQSAIKTRRRKTYRRQLLIGLAVLLIGFGAIEFPSSHAAAASPKIKSGVSGYCLDVHDDSHLAGAVVDSWKCNGSAAQSWKLGLGVITHGDNVCLATQGNHTTVGTVLVANTCSNASGQLWLADKTGYQNPASGLCLSLPDGQVGTQLVLASCQQLSQPGESWDYDASGQVDSCAGLAQKGPKVACYAEQDWTIWQSGTPNHNSLLNDYTNGYGYEEWCADFVSYVYRQAGYPFAGGESDGWDENIASNIQNMGFTVHQAGSYTPQPGDVAFFDYPGGHVEIVVSGGNNPTFVYGNSGVVDPATGNGEMAANAITQDSNGQVTYYLSPN